MRTAMETDPVPIEERPGQAVRAIRRRLGLSQAGFARALGVQRNTVNRYEHDQIRPGLRVLLVLLRMAETPCERAQLRAEVGRYSLDANLVNLAEGAAAAAPDAELSGTERNGSDPNYQGSATAAADGVAQR